MSSVAQANENPSPYASNNVVKSSDAGTEDSTTGFRGSSSLGTRDLGSSTGGIGTKGSNGSSGGGGGGSGTKGSKGSKSGGDGGGGGGDGPFCNQCGAIDFSYIHLEGEFPFGSIILPGFDGSKLGSTVTVNEKNLLGYAEYFDSYGGDPYIYDVNGTITGTCTIIGFSPPVSNAIDICELHCTVCIRYSGSFCDSPDHYNGYRELWEPERGMEYKKECCPVEGFLTATGDVNLGVRLDGNGEIVDTLNQTEFIEGFASITGCNFDQAGCTTGGVAFLEYSPDLGAFAVGLKVPFSQEALCKLQDYAFDYLYG